MDATSTHGGLAVRHREEQIKKYWSGDLSRKVYLLRRQRKAILENCRRIVVVGVSADPDSASFVALERFLGMGLEMIPVAPGRESLLGVRCYERLRDVPGNIDIVQVYPAAGIDLLRLARDAVEKRASTFWLEVGLLASPEVEEVLAEGRVQLVEYENLETEYLKHTPLAPPALRKDRKGAKVFERMTRNPVTVSAGDALKDALAKMERGKFRHLPLVDEEGKLIAILSDRDIRLILPSLPFVNKEDAGLQVWSMKVEQAAVYDPITISPEAPLKEAAGLMLRWHVGGLPVVDRHGKLIGIITYTDILREFVGRDESR
jgi:CBS domain-containing protein/predicted CoA-binding protein